MPISLFGGLRWEIMGTERHFNIKTTERYLHVTKEKLVNIISPLDDLWKNESIGW